MKKADDFKLQKAKHAKDKPLVKLSSDLDRDIIDFIQ